MFNGGGGFCVNDGGWIFCLLCSWVFYLMLVGGYLFIVIAGFFVYGSDCAFVLMVVIVFFV